MSFREPSIVVVVFGRGAAPFGARRPRASSRRLVPDLRKPDAWELDVPSDVDARALFLRTPSALGWGFVDRRARREPSP